MTSTQTLAPLAHPGTLAAVSGNGNMIADPKTVVAQVKAVQEIMKAVMKEGVHFGVIPGTQQPSLYKPGSEVLLSAFKISVEPNVREIRDGNHITYQIECVGRHIATGLVVGVGIGEASTAEEKYAWRASVCPEEYDATPEDRRRVKWNKGKWDNTTRSNGPGWSVQQVRTNPSDLANTVLKMAKKRAQIDLCLTALAASDIFTQDVEDLPPEYLENGAAPDDGQQQQKAKPNRYTPKEKTGAPATGSISEGQVRLFKAKLGSSTKTEADLLKQFGADSIEAFPKSKVNEALDWIAGKGASNG